MARRRGRDLRGRHDLGRSATTHVITHVGYTGAGTNVPRPAVPVPPVLPVRPL